MVIDLIDHVATAFRVTRVLADYMVDVVACK